MAYIEDLVLENVRIIRSHMNFEGRAGVYNRAGDKSFSVVIEPQDVDRLIEAGWQVKEIPPRDDIDGSEPLYYIPVRVNYDSQVRPPEVYLVTRNGLVKLDKETVGTIDHAEITNIDCTIHPHKWENNGKTGVKAYLRNMYVTIREDVLANKYEDMFANGRDME